MAGVTNIVINTKWSLLLYILLYILLYYSSTYCCIYCSIIPLTVWLNINLRLLIDENPKIPPPWGAIPQQTTPTKEGGILCWVGARTKQKQAHWWWSGQSRQSGSPIGQRKVVTLWKQRLKVWKFSALMVIRTVQAVWQPHWAEEGSHAFKVEAWALSGRASKQKLYPYKFGLNKPFLGPRNLNIVFWNPPHLIRMLDSPSSPNLNVEIFLSGPGVNATGAGANIEMRG